MAYTRLRVAGLALLVLIAGTGPTLPVSAARPAASPSLGIEGSPFHPDGDGEREHVRVVLTLDGAAEVDVRVHDFDGRAVRTLASDEVLPAGEHVWRWDGRAGSGRRMRSGPYRVVVAIRTGQGTLRRLAWVTLAARVPYPVRPGAVLVAVDPGHGGIADGAVWMGLREDDVNLDIGLRLEAMLKGAGVRVLMTRRIDRYVNTKRVDLDGRRPLHAPGRAHRAERPRQRRSGGRPRRDPQQRDWLPLRPRHRDLHASRPDVVAGGHPTRPLRARASTSATSAASRLPTARQRRQVVPVHGAAAVPQAPDATPVAPAVDPRGVALHRPALRASGAPQSGRAHRDRGRLLRRDRAVPRVAPLRAPLRGARRADGGPGRERASTSAFASRTAGRSRRLGGASGRASSRGAPLRRAAAPRSRRRRCGRSPTGSGRASRSRSWSLGSGCRARPGAGS